MWRLQGFDGEVFVRRYWQKEPCVIRQAFAGIRSIVSPEELAGLACEQGVHSRLVLETGGARPWQVRYGPFTEKDLTSLPEQGYSLLVSECEKWVPELRAMLDQFRFIPDWRIDDLMISYAPPGGSVGPHVDEYDVFLVQVEGRRRWRYDDCRLDSPALVPGLELAILESFEARHDVLLEPGDMLYLPPGCAHHGTAVDACITWSIGFRAPDALETLDSLSLEIDRLDLAGARYRDPDLETDRHNAEITDREIERFRELVIELLDGSPQLWREAVGRMLSDSPLRSAEPVPAVTLEELRQGAWIRHPDTRMLYHQTPRQTQLFCNGRSYSLPPTDSIRELAGMLCQQWEWSPSLIRRCLDHEALANCLLALAATGAIDQDLE